MSGYDVYRARTPFRLFDSRLSPGLWATFMVIMRVAAILVFRPNMSEAALLWFVAALLVGNTLVGIYAVKALSYRSR
jgi:hypothetical protein